MMKIFSIILLVISSVFLFSNCDDTITNQDVDDRVIPDKDVSFSKHIYPLFQVKCFSCHGNGVYEAGLDLTLRTRFVDGRIVVPGDTITSILVWRINRPPRAGFAPMPPLYTPQMNSNQIKGIKTWIAEGAKEN